jgi:hypothetical protein
VLGSRLKNGEVVSLRPNVHAERRGHSVPAMALYRSRARSSVMLGGGLWIAWPFVLHISENLAVAVAPVLSKPRNDSALGQ